jgi:hypothetical protein
MIGVGHELLLPAHEPGRLAVTHPLFDFGQGETDLAEPGEVIRWHDEIVPARKV